MFLRVIVIWYNVGFMEKTKSFTTSQANYISYFSHDNTVKAIFPWLFLTNRLIYQIPRGQDRNNYTFKSLQLFSEKNIKSFFYEL